MRPLTTTAPAIRPGHKVSTVGGVALGRHGYGHGQLQSVEENLDTGMSALPTTSTHPRIGADRSDGTVWGFRKGRLPSRMIFNVRASRPGSLFTSSNAWYELLGPEQGSRFPGANPGTGSGLFDLNHFPALCCGHHPAPGCTLPAELNPTATSSGPMQLSGILPKTGRTWAGNGRAPSFSCQD